MSIWLFITSLDLLKIVFWLCPQASIVTFIVSSSTGLLTPAIPARITSFPCLIISVHPLSTCLFFQLKSFNHPSANRPYLDRCAALLSQRSGLIVTTAGHTRGPHADRRQHQQIAPLLVTRYPHLSLLSINPLCSFPDGLLKKPSPLRAPSSSTTLFYRASGSLAPPSLCLRCNSDNYRSYFFP